MKKQVLTALVVLLSLPALGNARAQDVASASAPPPAQEEVAVKEAMQGVADVTQDKEGELDPDLYMGIQQSYQASMKMRGGPGVMPDQIKTLFFTRWQHELLQDAKFGFWTRRPEEYELNKDPEALEKRVRDIREISLAGILYSAPEDWVVWLNGQRLTPDAIPKQVIDIQVAKDYVELKWFDSWTNLIFPVRLRPHQRFNLDTRIFLPGEALR